MQLAAGIEMEKVSNRTCRRRLSGFAGAPNWGMRCV